MAPRMLACLAVAALAGTVSCTDAPLAPQDVALSATVAPATDSVLLTYLCGNMFRIRNTSFEPRAVRWDIYNATPADTGSLRLRGRDVGATHVDYYVTARTRGTMRVFVGGVLRQTKANGNRAACTAPVDTTPLPIAPTVTETAMQLVAQAGIALAPDGSEYRRTVANLRFTPSATLLQKRQMLARFSAQIIAVYPRFYRVRINDTGEDAEALMALLSQIRLDQAVDRVEPVRAWREIRQYGARYPVDGPSFLANDYIQQSSSVWVASALRLPQAWACETGLYGATLSRIAIYEQNFPLTFSADIIPSLQHPVVRLTQWKDTLKNPLPVNARGKFESHGHIVAGLVAAMGDNSQGLAGPLWKADLRLFTFANTDSLRGTGPAFFSAFMRKEIAAARPRVLTLSSDSRVSKDTLDREGDFFDAYLALKTLMDSLPGLLVIQAAGNDAFTGEYTARDSADRSAFQEGLVMLQSESMSYRNRILFIGETDRSGRRAAESNAFTGLVELYAPGYDVPVLLPSGSVGIGRGTSFAAPTVAAIAGQLLAMDSTLSPADVKSLLLAGARDSVEGPDGVNVAPRPVTGITDVVYEADAYGSLRLLSSRAGTPLCGARLVPWRDPSQAAQQLYYTGTRAIRYGELAAETFPEFTASSQSEAPGGRLIAFAPFFERRLTGREWSSRTQTDSGERRIYGERDTLAYKLIRAPNDAPDAEPSELRVRLNSTRRTWHLMRDLQTTQLLRYGQPSLSPDGRRALVPFIEGSNPTATLQLAVLDTAAVSQVAVSAGNLDPFGLSAWSPDARQAIYFFWGTLVPDGAHITRPIMLNMTSGTPQIIALDAERHRYPVSVRWSDEGRRVTYRDVRLDINGFSECRERVFGVSAAALTLIVTRDLDLNNDCTTEIDPDNPESDYSKTLFGDANSGGLTQSPPSGGGSGTGGVSLMVRSDRRSAYVAALARQRGQHPRPRALVHP